MTTGTKIFLAVFAAFIGVLVLYYGVLMPEAQKLPAVSAATREIPAAPPVPTAPPQSPSESRFSPTTPAPSDPTSPSLPIFDPAGPSSSTTGLLTETVQQQTASTGGSAIQDPTSTSVEPTPVRGAGDPPPASSPMANQPLSLNGGVSPVRSSSNSTSKPATTTTPPTERTPPATTEYIVKSGDTMSSIAQNWFGDPNKWSLIAKENPLVDPARLSVGQKLRLPPKDAKPATVKEQAGSSSPATATSQPLYTVRSGDTLAKIAREYYGDVAKWKAIYDANKSVIGSDPADLKPGMKLKLPPPAKPAAN